MPSPFLVFLLNILFALLAYGICSPSQGKLHGCDSFINLGRGDKSKQLLSATKIPFVAVGLRKGSARGF